MFSLGDHSNNLIIIWLRFPPVRWCHEVDPKEFDDRSEDKSGVAKTVLEGGLCCLEASLKKKWRTDNTAVVECISRKSCGWSALGRCLERV